MARRAELGRLGQELQQAEASLQAVRRQIRGMVDNALREA
jgi:hypothetical protein